RYPHRIWAECRHWFNLAGEWAPVEEFQYALTMQTLIPWSHLHQWVKKATVDLQRFALDVIETPPFSGLPPLAAHVEERFHGGTVRSRDREARDWLAQLGADLARVKLDDEEETQRVRQLGRELAATAWVNCPKLET